MLRRLVGGARRRTANRELVLAFVGFGDLENSSFAGTNDLDGRRTFRTVPALQTVGKQHAGVGRGVGSSPLAPRAERGQIEGSWVIEDNY